MRAITFTALSLALLAFCLVLGFSPAVELWFGTLALPISVVTVALMVFIFALLNPKARALTLKRSQLLAIAGLLSTLGVAIVSWLSNSFTCEQACLGILNNALGYACGEWARGCIAEWFTLFFLGFSTALFSISKTRSNQTL